MDERSPALTRVLQHVQDRRSSVIGFAAALGLMGSSRLGAAKKRRRRRHNRSRRLTCAQQCDASHTFCFNRVLGPPFCGGASGPSACLLCSSDQDCIGSGFPYCVRTFTIRATGETIPYGGCGDYPDGTCIDIAV